MVKVKLNLALIKDAGKEEVLIHTKGNRKLCDILSEIGISSEEVGMVIKNKTWTPLDCDVEENDELQIFPHLEGG
jgi:sulfur carrier protein ThiS